MKVIPAFVNIPCNEQCYRRRTGRSLRAKWKTDKSLEKKVSWASHLIHWLCCACCSVVAVICVCSSCSSGLCGNFLPLLAVGKRCELCARHAFKSDLGWMHADRSSLNERSVWRVENRVSGWRGKAAACDLSSSVAPKGSDDGKNKCQVLRNQIVRLKRHICIVFKSN